MAAKKRETVIRTVRAAGLMAIVNGAKVTFFLPLSCSKWKEAGGASMTAAGKVARLHGLALPREAAAALIAKIEEG